jgi:hypothetical protein
MHMVMKYAGKQEMKEKHNLFLEVLKVIENEMQKEEGSSELEKHGEEAQREKLGVAE